MIRKVGIAIAVILGLFLIYVAFMKPQYSITRKITIKQPAEVIFPYINNAKLMQQWAPWQEMDPNMVMSYSGPEAGTGAVSSWESKGQMGTGSATVTESVTNILVRTKLEYTKPYVMKQEAIMAIQDTGDESIVSWSVTGENNFIGRLFCVFMDMDKVVGGTFEKGLNQLKANLEKAP